MDLSSLEEQKIAVDIEDIGFGDDEHNAPNPTPSANKPGTRPTLIDDLELDSFDLDIDIGDDFDLGNLDLDIGEQDLSDILLQDTRRIEQEEDAKVLFWLVIARAFACLV
jgi:hypothetical protein